MLAIRITTEGQLEELDIIKGQSLEQLQAGVGGMIEAVNISDTITMWVNEEGKFNNSDINPLATKVWESIYGRTDVIMGDTVFTGGIDMDGNTVGISLHDVGALRKILSL